VPSRFTFPVAVSAAAAVVLLGALLAGAVLSAPAASDRDHDEPWQAAQRGYTWEFPRDLGIHPDYKTEWWYVTGHLFPVGTEPAEAMAFQLTFFRVGLVPPGVTATDSDWAAGDLVMAHAALARPAAKTHDFTEVMWRAAPLLGGFGGAADTTLAWCQAPTGTAGRWEITRRGDAFVLRARDDRKGFAYDLVCTPSRPLVLHGDGGFSPKSAAGDEGSLYFSYTRMEVSGTVTAGGRTIDVAGTSWLDREIFTSTLAENQTGWDWLSLQLDDGRDLMLYRLRDAQGREDFALGTLVAVDGKVSKLPGEQWELSPLESWQSPATGAEYPVVWRLQIPAEGIDLELRAVMPEQENVSPLTGIHYWEGAVIAAPRGAKPGTGNLGRGFIELTGYGKDSRPPV
jgi:predicted secreted hydrolase